MPHPRRLSPIPSISAAGLLVAVLLAGSPASSEQAVPDITVPVLPAVTTILSTSTTILGQPITYPEGPAEVTAAIIDLPPGAQTGWHEHAVPLFGYILEGTLTVDYGERGLKTYPAGSGFMEAMDWPHNGDNRTDSLVRILAVYAGNRALPNATPTPSSSGSGP